MKKIILLLSIILLSFSSCEKDDICDAATPTTPRVIIDFYDIANPTILKNVTNLKIIAEGMPEGLIINPNGSSTTKYIADGVSKIKIPLRTLEDITKYSFILNFGNSNPALTNTDNLEFDYSRNTVFVSRACGYKTLFQLNSSSLTTTDPLVPDGFWIQSITVVTKNINDENETHIKIYF